MADIQITEKRRQWILNSVFTLILTIGTLYFNSVESRHTRDIEQADKFKQELVRENAQQNQEIAVLKAQLVNMTRLLERMETKIDNLSRR